MAAKVCHVVLVSRYAYYYQCAIVVVQYVPEHGQVFHKFQSVNSYKCVFLLLIKQNYAVVRLTLFLADRGCAATRNLVLIIYNCIFYTLCHTV